MTMSFVKNVYWGEIPFYMSIIGRAFLLFTAALWRGALLAVQSKELLLIKKTAFI